jgi:hypothetical protein
MITKVKHKKIKNSGTINDHMDKLCQLSDINILICVFLSLNVFNGLLSLGMKLYEIVTK